MKSGIRAFSLTELLIVLVVIALLFAAMAPIVTKRHIAETHETESIWNFVTGDAEKNAYFDPGNETWTSSVYMGMVPTTADNNAGKLVIDSGTISYGGATYHSPQMQFRFSKNPQQQGRGLNSAVLYFDGSDIVFGSSLSPYSCEYSTIYGLSNLESDIKAFSLSILGNDAMGQAKINAKGGGSNQQYITAVGHRALNKLGTANSSNTVNGIYVGSGAGAGGAEIDAAPTDNVVIGYGAMNKEGSAGSHNVFLGAHTGNGFSSTSASYNTIVGSVFPGTSASYNTIVGYGVYTNGDPAVKAMTAIGYGACNSISGANNGSRVCLGYNSGYSTNNTPSVFNTDSGEHIFIGGKPQSNNTRGFSGRSILEVHNNTIDTQTYGNVVINSNLVVRGNFYPSDENGKVSYNVFTDTQTGGAETAYYRCSNDAYQSILNYNNYVCTELTQSNPKSVNMLIKGGNCSTSDGYPNGNGCANVVSSDRRLKTAITLNNDGLNKILKLRPYNYTYKDDEKTPQVGVIAQDLQKVFPDAVSKDKKGYLKIRIEDMFYALVNAVKELAQKLEDISSKIVKANSDILSIKKEHQDINKQILVLEKRIKKLERK